MKMQNIEKKRKKNSMWFSGPRMLLYHPVMAIWHVVCSMREKKKQKQEGIV